MVNTEIRLIIFFAAKNGETLYSQQKQDQELTVAQIMNFLLEKDVCYDQHVLLTKLLAFPLLHFVLQGKICLLLQVFLDFLLLHSSPL